ncbi:sterile alpha motif domain-containing protein 9-like [Engraulis encrasicolus]|uniref:sterile alpha motif domain-containing protein 9-like n=1 Tax=Engraulis encrasicolus TaxID=184585 RepID=UPI002FD434C2
MLATGLHTQRCPHTLVSGKGEVGVKDDTFRHTEDWKRLSIAKWTEDQVSIRKIHEQEVNGTALLELMLEDLMLLNIKLGPARVIINKREQLSKSVKTVDVQDEKMQPPFTRDITSGAGACQELEKEPQIEKEKEPPCKKMSDNENDAEKHSDRHHTEVKASCSLGPQELQSHQEGLTAAKETLSSHKDSEQATTGKMPLEEDAVSVVMPMTKKDCRPRPFEKEGINHTYIKSNVLYPETGASDLISPCHEFKSFATAAELDRTRLQAKFAREVLKFATGCMNVRSNGTIHFGVMDSKEDKGYVHGEIIGIPVLEKDVYVDALDYIENGKCFSALHSNHVRQCVRPPEFVKVIDMDTDQKRYVVEVDIVPSINIVKSMTYAVRLPNFNEKSNKIIYDKGERTIFRRAGASSKPVDDLNEFYTRVQERDALREDAENTQSPTKAEPSKDLGRKLTMLVTRGKKHIDKGEWFILVTNRFGHEDLQNIEFLLNMKLFSVFDFDPHSNVSGFCQEYLKHRTANLHFLQDYRIPSGLTMKEFESRLCLFDQTSWIFCNGRSDFKGKEANDDKTWFKTKKTQLKECVSLICKQILPKCTFTLIFLLTSPVEDPLLHTYSEFFSDMEGHEDIIFITESQDNFAKWQSFAGGSFCDGQTVARSSVVGMKMSHVNETLQRIQSGSRTAKHLPTYGRGECLLDTREEQKMFSLEILFMDHCDETKEDVIEAEKESIEQHFYHGGKVSWMNFWLAEKKHVGEVIQRDAYHEILNLLSDSLKTNTDATTTHGLNIFHHPGSGGSTVARQVLWNNRKKLRCAVVKPSYSAIAVSEHAYLLRRYDENDSLKCLPVVLLVEDCDDDFLCDLKHEFEVAVNREKTQRTLCFIVLSCRRSYGPEKMCKESPLHNVSVTHKLSDEEKRQFAGKRKTLEKQYKPEFILTFVLMSEGFDQKYVEQFVKNLLQGIDHDHIVTCIIRYVALLNTYVQNSFLSQSHCEALLTNHGMFEWHPATEKEEFRRHAFENALTEQARLVFVHLQDERTNIKSIRVIHPLVAKEILQQLLHNNKEESGLALELLSDDILFDHRFDRYDYVKFLRDLFMRRDQVNKGDEADSFFSPLIEHVRDTETVEKAIDLLKEAYRRFDKDPLFAQHLARLNYSQDKFEEAEHWAELAAKKSPNNPFILHTKGQVYRKWFYAKVAGIKKESKSINAVRITDAVGTAVKAMDCFQDCQTAAIKDAESMNNAGFFAAVEVGCRLLQLFSHSSAFSNKIEGMKYLLTDYIPEEVKEPWEHFHSKLKGLHVIIRSALEWISEDLSYFQTDPGADEEETEDPVKHPKMWLLTKSAEYGKYFGDSFPSPHSTSNIPPPTLIRMKIYQLGGGNMTSIFSILTDSKQKNKVKVLEELICLYKQKGQTDQMDLVNHIACHIALSCLSNQSQVLISLKELQDLSQKFPKDKQKCQPNALFLLTLLFWPEEHEREEDKEKKYKFVLSVVKFLTTCYHDKMKDIPLKRRRIYTHFFLGNGKGLAKIVHKSKVEITTKSLPVTEKRMRWYHGEGWKLPETAKLLRSVSGRTESHSIYLAGPQNLDFMVPAQNMASLPKSNENVTFYLGFTMRGPMAYNVTKVGEE